MGALRRHRSSGGLPHCLLYPGRPMSLLRAALSPQLTLRLASGSQCCTSAHRIAPPIGVQLPLAAAPSSSRRRCASRNLVDPLQLPLGGGLQRALRHRTTERGQLQTVASGGGGGLGHGGGGNQPVRRVACCLPCHL